LARKAYAMSFVKSLNTHVLTKTISTIDIQTINLFQSVWFKATETVGTWGFCEVGPTGDTLNYFGLNQRTGTRANVKYGTAGAQLSSTTAPTDGIWWLLCGVTERDKNLAGTLGPRVYSWNGTTASANSAASYTSPGNAVDFNEARIGNAVTEGPDARGKFAYWSIWSIAGDGSAIRTVGDALEIELRTKTPDNITVAGATLLDWESFATTQGAFTLAAGTFDALDNPTLTGPGAADVSQSIIMVM
jgi:hypothetical protein